MAKTRSQTSNPQIKQEADDGKSKLRQLLYCSKSTLNKSKTTHLETSRTKSVPVSIKKTRQQVTSTTPLSFVSKKGPWITHEKIKKLVECVTKDKLSTKEAAKIVGMGHYSALKYYREYKNDRKLPLPKIARQDYSKTFTDEEVKKLIGYLVDDKMSINRAAEMVNMSPTTAQKYFSIYQNDPNGNIPSPSISRRIIKTGFKNHTYKHVKELIDYITHDKISITAASRKVGISRTTAFKYYNRYINDPERKIPNPRSAPEILTHDQIEKMLSYVINDNMSVRMASRKTNMSPESGKSHYKRYLDDPKNKTGLQNKNPLKDRVGKDRLKLLISHIFNDKLKVKEAAAKLGISRAVAFKHYYRYIKNPSHYDFIPKVIFKDTNVRYKFNERLKNMFEYIVEDNMSLEEASKKADVGRTAATRYYEEYLSDPEHKIPTQSRLGLSKEKMKNMLHYIFHDKMSSTLASSKSNICYITTRFYQNKYMEYFERKTSLSSEDRPDFEISDELAQIFEDVHNNRHISKDAQTLEPSKLNPTIELEPMESRIQRYNTRSRANLNRL